jgi:hypothetical protein
MYDVMNETKRGESRHLHSTIFGINESLRTYYITGLNLKLKT